MILDNKPQFLKRGVYFIINAIQVGLQVYKVAIPLNLKKYPIVSHLL